MKNTSKLLTGLVALPPLFLTTLTAQAHNGVKHPVKHHVHGKSDKPHAVKSTSKTSHSKMSHSKMAGMKMSAKK